MLKLTLFFAVLLTLGVTDIVLMKKEGFRREMVPYMVITVAAGLAAIMVFAGPNRSSIMGVLLKILNISE